MQGGYIDSEQVGDLRSNGTECQQEDIRDATSIPRMVTEDEHRGGGGEIQNDH